MDETYGSYVMMSVSTFMTMIDDTDHYTDADTDNETDDDANDDANDDSNDDTDDGGRGNRRPVPGGAVHFFTPGEGVHTHFWDLDPVWERERERVNRDALTRLKTPGGAGGL